MSASEPNPVLETTSYQAQTHQQHPQPAIEPDVRLRPIPAQINCSLACRQSQAMRPSQNQRKPNGSLSDSEFLLILSPSIERQAMSPQ